MDPDTLSTIIREYGWSMVLIWVLYREVWPWMRDRLVPSYIEDRKQENARNNEARIQQEKRLADLEERQVAAFEKVASVVDEMSKNIMLTNERLTLILINQQQLMNAYEIHDRKMDRAITRMEVRTGEGFDELTERINYGNVRQSGKGQAKTLEEGREERDRNQATE